MWTLAWHRDHSAWPFFIFLLVILSRFDTVEVTWLAGKFVLLYSPFLLHCFVPCIKLAILCLLPLFTICICPVDEEEDEEEVYKMAGVMAQCGGLECMLNRLTGIKDFKQGRHLLTVSLSFWTLGSIYMMANATSVSEVYSDLCCTCSVGAEVSVH